MTYRQLLEVIAEAQRRQVEVEGLANQPVRFEGNLSQREIAEAHLRTATAAFDEEIPHDFV